MFKDILVPIDSANSTAVRIDAAVKLSSQCNAHATGLYVVEPVNLPGYAEVAIGADLLERTRLEYMQQAEDAGKAFRERMDSEGIANEFRISEGLTGTRIVDQAHYSDLVVMAQRDPNDYNDVSGSLADQIILGCGRPVMVVPYIGAPDQIGNKVLLAWNGTREAVRALHDALPILQNAKEVVVMTINAENSADHIPGSDISLHLARHGVNATVNSTVSKDIDIGDTLLSRASDLGVDCMVMGAYGHSRFRELVMGGATRHILRHMTVPVLMSH